jgi:hypothetical protein
VRGIRIGPGTLDITVARRGPATAIEHREQRNLEVVEGTVEAPLLGAPPSTASARRAAAGHVVPPTVDVAER